MNKVKTLLLKYLNTLEYFMCELKIALFQEKYYSLWFAFYRLFVVGFWLFWFCVVVFVSLGLTYTGQVLYPYTPETIKYSLSPYILLF